MKSIPFSKFKLLKAGDLKEVKSFKVTSDGDLLCFVIIPQGESLIKSYLKTQVEEAVEVNNNFGSKDVE